MKYLIILLLTLTTYSNAGIIPDWNGYSDTGAQAIKFTDIDGNSDDSFFTMMLESAGFAPDNTMGLYIYNNVTGEQEGGLFEIFTGDQSVGDWTDLVFDFTNHTITRVTDSTSDFFQGSLVTNLTTLNLTNLEIGVYLTNKPGDTFFSHTALNVDGIRHVGIYETNRGGLTFGWEDLYGGGDRDYNDMVVHATDVAIRVPEPTSVALFGLALMGFALRKQLS